MRALSTIRSSQNPVLKRVRLVASGKEPNTLVLEGERLIAEARRRGLALELLLYAESRAHELRGAQEAGLPVRVVADGLLKALSRLDEPPGILALVRAPDAVPLESIEPAADALVLVIAGIADPRNLGAVARTAEAAGASTLVLLRGGCSPWNDKALRGSMGSLLRLPVARAKSAQHVADVLGGRGFRHVRAATRDGAPLEGFDWSGPVALWISSETGELPEVAARFEGVTVPMAGSVESLNVNVAAGLLLFAAGRVRRE